MDNYFQSSFYPIQDTVIRICEEYAAFTSSMGVMVELEYQYLNFTHPDGNYNYNEIYKSIISSSYTKAKSLLKLERTMPIIRDYQSAYMYSPSILLDIDSNPKKIKSVNFIDLLDSNLIYLQEIIPQILNFRQINYDLLIFLQRTYVYYLLPGGNSWNQVKLSWMSECLSMNDNLKQSMIIFLVFALGINFFTGIQVIFLYNFVNRLSLIFLRCKQQEALREIPYIEKSLENYKSVEEFCDINFAEQLMNRKEQVLDEKNTSYKKNTNLRSPNIKNLKKVKRKYKSHSHMLIKPISKTKGYCFVILIFLISFFYFFLSYYSWSQFSLKIQEVINLDTSFSSAYVFTVSVMACNNLYLREFIIKNPSYEYLNETYQKPNTRKAFFLGAVNKRIATITSIFNSELPMGIIQAKGTIEDQNFIDLLDRNICQVLLNLNKIQESELNVCNNIWDGAFQKGILIAASQYLKQINEIAFLRNSSYPNITQNIFSYVQDTKHQEFLLGEYIFSETLLLFYAYINEFYNPIIEQQRFNIQVGILVSMILLGAFIIFLAGGAVIYMRVYYKYLALSLYVIPFEKITEEEGTIQIIEKFTKNK